MLPEEILKGIRAYYACALPSKEYSQRVEVWRGADACYVTFPDGVDAYDLVNSFGWLLYYDPSSDEATEKVKDVQAWITRAGRTLHFPADAQENASGDTFVAVDSNGQSLRVYIPELTICIVSKSVGTFATPPATATMELVASIVVITEPPGGDVNSNLEITDPVDTDLSDAAQSGGVSTGFVIIVVAVVALLLFYFL